MKRVSRQAKKKTRRKSVGYGSPSGEGQEPGKQPDDEKAEDEGQACGESGTGPDLTDRPQDVPLRGLRSGEIRSAPADEGGLESSPLVECQPAKVAERERGAGERQEEQRHEDREPADRIRQALETEESPEQVGGPRVVDGQGNHGEDEHDQRDAGNRFEGRANAYEEEGVPRLEKAEQLPTPERMPAEAPELGLEEKPLAKEGKDERPNHRRRRREERQENTRGGEESAGGNRGEGVGPVPEGETVGLQERARGQGLDDEDRDDEEEQKQVLSVGRPRVVVEPEEGEGRVVGRALLLEVLEEIGPDGHRVHVGAPFPSVGGGEVGRESEGEERERPEEDLRQPRRGQARVAGRKNPRQRLRRHGPGTQVNERLGVVVAGEGVQRPCGGIPGDGEPDGGPAASRVHRVPIDELGKRRAVFDEGVVLSEKDERGVEHSLRGAAWELEQLAWRGVRRPDLVVAVKRVRRRDEHAAEERGVLRVREEDVAVEGEERHARAVERDLAREEELVPHVRGDDPDVLDPAPGERGENGRERKLVGRGGKPRDGRNDVAPLRRVVEGEFEGARAGGPLRLAERLQELVLFVGRPELGDVHREDDRDARLGSGRRPRREFAPAGPPLTVKGVRFGEEGDALEVDAQIAEVSVEKVPRRLVRHDRGAEVDGEPPLGVLEPGQPLLEDPLGPRDGGGSRDDSHLERFCEFVRGRPLDEREPQGMGRTREVGAENPRVPVPREGRPRRARRSHAPR